VVNLALEGIMLVTAFFIVWGSVAFGGIVAGLMVAVLAGILIALLHAVATVTFRVDQIVSGVAINILALGVTRTLAQKFYAQETQSTTNPFRFEQLLGISSFAFVLIPVTAIAWFLMYRTRFGLRLRTVGENPEAADTASRRSAMPVCSSRALCAASPPRCSTRRSGSAA
jgi:simple sugar transport system permease protein